MSRIRIVSIALVGLALSTVGAAKPQSPSTQPSREQQLEATIRSQQIQIQMLEANLKAAQDRAADANRQLAVLEMQLIVFKEKAAMPDPKVIPPGWNQRKFNGMTLYLVPCDTSAAQPQAAPTAPSK